MSVYATGSGKGFSRSYSFAQLTFLFNSYIDALLPAVLLERYPKQLALGQMPKEQVEAWKPIVNVVPSPYYRTFETSDEEWGRNYFQSVATLDLMVSRSLGIY